MNAKFSNLRHRLCTSLPLIAASAAVVLALPRAGTSQTVSGYGTSSRAYYGQQQRAAYAGHQRAAHAPRLSSSHQIVYYRGADGRLFGVSMPQSAAQRYAATYSSLPPSMSARQTQRQPQPQPQPSSPQALIAPAHASGIVIEDTGSVPSGVAPLASPAVEAITISNVASTVDSSARSRAEQTLKRFEELQGVQAAGAESAPPQQTASIAPDEEAPQSLPPPKSY